MKFWYPTLLAALISTSASAVEDLRVPGGVAVIPVEADAQPRFNGKPVLTPRKRTIFAVVGLALSTEPGDYTLESDGQRIPFKFLLKSILSSEYISRISVTTPTLILIASRK